MPRTKRSKRSTVAIPHWIQNPHDLHLESAIKVPVDASQLHLQPLLASRLKACGFKHLFPIQAHIVPKVIESKESLYHGGDICVSAPTGSGKTLCYAIPILNSLATRVCPRLRAAIVLPTRQLVRQVLGVLQQCSVGITGQNRPLVVADVAGSASFAKEQALLMPNDDGSSRVDILVATPGRLVDHLNQTPGFTLEHLEYLVIDEADRLLNDQYQGWLSAMHASIYKHRSDPTFPTVAGHTDSGPYLQQLLFSATLARNPASLTALTLAYPQLFVASHAAKGDAHLEGRLMIPQQLDEHALICEADEKPLALLYLLVTLQVDRTLVFTGSIDTAHRLHALLAAYGGLKVAELSSANASSFKKTLRQFVQGEISTIVCTDSLARGIDLELVENVVCYDIPQNPQTYMHRVGRTARAGAHGDAYSLLLPTQRSAFLQLRKSIDAKPVDVTDVTPEMYDDVITQYKNALLELQESMSVQSTLTTKSSTGKGKRKSKESTMSQGVNVEAGDAEV
eukprot:m.43046 g.43046  ORF g.43046 m.43046 type:complete len:510 (+) comp10756_c0_seq1:111-1640(+)